MFVYSDALDLVCESLNSPTFEGTTKAKEADLDFLSDLLNNPVVQSLVEVHSQVFHKKVQFSAIKCLERTWS